LLLFHYHLNGSANSIQHQTMGFNDCFDDESRLVRLVERETVEGVRKCCISNIPKHQCRESPYSSRWRL